MSRLPVVGEDKDVWAPVLNDFLLVSHKADGTLENDALTPYTSSVFADLNAAILAIGATEATLLITSSFMVTANAVVPPTMQLLFLRGGSLNNGTKTVTINGHISAGFFQIFDGTGAITFGANTIKEVYPEWWGAVGTADDSPAIQAAIDSVKDAGETIESDLTDASKVMLPKSRHLINTPLKLYSGITLEGLGTSTTIGEGASFVGTELITLEGTTYNQNCTIKNIVGVATTPTVAVIGQNVTNVTRLTLDNIQIDASRGVILDSYTQECRLIDVMSYGLIDLLLHLKGNANYIKGLNKESASGSTIDPYVFVENHAGGDSNGNIFIRTTIEGTGSANKSGIKLVGVGDITFIDLWLELTATNGNIIDIVSASGKVSFEGNLTGPSPTNKFKARNAYNIGINYFNTDGVVAPLSDYLDIDSTANITIDNLLSRAGQCAHILDTNRNLTIKENNSRNQMTGGVIAGWNSRQHQEDSMGQNLFVNPSFEAGNYDWTMPGTYSTEEYVNSEVNDGLMAHLVPNANGSYQVYQSYTVTADMVGRDITFTGLGKITVAGFLSPFFSGAGVTSSTNNNRVGFGEGWCILSATVRPTSSGALLIGFNIIVATTASHIYLDDCCASVGQKTLINPTKFGSMELSGKTVLSAAAAPTTGTWKVGDMVFDSVPVSGQQMGWMCTVAGSPGTWKAMANLA